MTKPKPLVSDEEVRAASDALDRLSEAAGRENPVPATFMRFILEEAAMVRTGMKKPGSPISSNGHHSPQGERT